MGETKAPLVNCFFSSFLRMRTKDLARDFFPIQTGSKIQLFMKQLCLAWQEGSASLPYWGMFLGLRGTLMATVIPLLACEDFRGSWFQNS